MTEAARRLGITRTTLRRLVKEGRLPTAENPLDKRQRLIPLRALETLRGAGDSPPRLPRTLGIVHDPTLQSSELEDMMEAEWRQS
ncbi:MAG: helix-turn-helix domain-containing protein [Chloroflexi bacterium]|nr:helix-turn-helix domain-containing protein [Chloroflexota bacterium]